jgi:hypothetical protein
MQRRAFWFVSLFPVVSVLAAGCNDLGTCDDPARGRTTVNYGSKGVVYTGQAILLNSCASGCHSSGAKGGARQGAPAGLDFDLQPITTPTPGPVVSGADGGIVAVQVDAVQVAGLRARQRKVFDERELIWEQVDKGLMPPVDTFRNLMNIFRTVFGADGACTRGDSLESLDLDTTREELRNWLACGTPIVETSSALLPFAQPGANAAKPDTAAGAAAYAGATGYQYPECKVDVAPGGPTFEDVYNNVLASSAYGCTPACHGTGAAMGGFDIGNIDTAYTTLLGANGQGGATSCSPMNPAPFVKPGDPTGSYLITKLGGGGTLCMSLMPLGSATGISSADLDIIRQWIMAGAMR